MSTAAEQLRSAREAKNLTVEQVADTTKIRTDHIHALEEGNFGVFSAPIYIRGSVKNYAAALKLDTAAVLAALEAELKGTEKFSEPPPLSDQKNRPGPRHAAAGETELEDGAGRRRARRAGGDFLRVVLGVAHHQKSDPLKNLPPAVYQPASSGDTLPLPKQMGIYDLDAIQTPSAK